MIKVCKISEDQILEVWREYLWPGRQSAIETRSAMQYCSSAYNMDNMSQPAVFLGIYGSNHQLVGVNSGHICADNSYRSRGLWVDPAHRGQGYGRALLIETIHHGAALDCNFVWSFPRKTSWNTYESAGFIRTSDWQASETSDQNAYCCLRLK